MEPVPDDADVRPRAGQRSVVAEIEDLHARPERDSPRFADRRRPSD
jgi:hypothetical protein